MGGWILNRLAASVRGVHLYQPGQISNRRTLFLERLRTPRATRSQLNENFMANKGRPSRMPVVRSGGTRSVQPALDSGYFNKRS